jgi:hypothetical protein
MANRSTRFILKNNSNSAAPFSGATLLAGEPIVNTAAGIMMFSGVTSGGNDWVPAGPNGNGNFFEVGSNLYNLKIRNQITSYSGTSNLTGLFLSGTSNGFVLAPIASITGVDTYITGFTYNNNVLTIKQNIGQPDLTAVINTMTGLTVNGTLSATTANFGTENVNTLNVTAGTITTLNSTTINGGAINVNNLTVTGSATYNKTATGATEIVNYDTLTAYSQTTDVYVTGNTLTAANNNTDTQSAILSYHGTPIGGPYAVTTQNTFTTGGTYNNSTKQITFLKNSGTGGTYTVDLSTIDVNDTYVTGGTVTTAPSNNSINGVIGLLYNQDIAPSTYSLPFTDVFTTGFTYNSTNNTFTLKDNSGNTFNQSFDTVSGLTFSNLTAGRVVYVGAGGLLTDEAGFTYDASTNVFSVPSDGTVNVGTGGLNVAGDAVIQGSLTVFGPAISAFTTQLYVEDPNITLNYNPTGNTTATSVGAGWTIQDGNGVNGGNVNLDIRALDTLTGLTSTQVPSITEYTSSTGYANRGLVTQLNDIVIRSTNLATPNGVRVLAEFDTLDGGQY